MEKPHKVHHKPSAGQKADKKDKAAGVDRTGGTKGYNPKVSVESCESVVGE
jgi:ribosome biogenesis protein BMS1